MATDVFASEELFDAAVVRAGGSRTFDVIGRPASGPTADWIFVDRRIIIEHKHIESDYAKTEIFQTNISQLREELSINSQYNQDRREFGRRILHPLEPPFAALAKKANQQIKSTANIAGWDTAAGILVVANRDLRTLPPQAIMFVLKNILSRPYFRGIHGIIYQTDHFVGRPDDNIDNLVWTSALRRECRPDLGEFIDGLLRTFSTVLEERLGPFDSHIETPDKTALNGLTARE